MWAHRTDTRQNLVVLDPCEVVGLIENQEFTQFLVCRKRGSILWHWISMKWSGKFISLVRRRSTLVSRTSTAMLRWYIRNRCECMGVHCCGKPLQKWCFGASRTSEIAYKSTPMWQISKAVFSGASTVSTKFRRLCQLESCSFETSNTTDQVSQQY